MGADEIKRILSVVSAVVSLVSLVIALRTRRQSNRDRVLDLRDAVLTNLVQNEQYASHLSLQSTFLLASLDPLLANSEEKHDRRINGVVEGLKELSKSMKELAGDIATTYAKMEVFKELTVYNRTAEQTLRWFQTSMRLITEQLRTKKCEVIVQEAKDIIDELRKARGRLRAPH